MDHLLKEKCDSFITDESILRLFFILFKNARRIFLKNLKCVYCQKEGLDESDLPGAFDISPI